MEGEGVGPGKSKPLVFRPSVQSTVDYRACTREVQLGIRRAKWRNGLLSTDHGDGFVITEVIAYMESRSMTVGPVSYNV